MRVNALGRALIGVACAVTVCLLLSGCVIIPPPLTAIARINRTSPVDPVDPFGPSTPSAPTKLAVDPISVTLRGGVPVVRLCEAATVDWMALNESLLTDDLSKGYVGVWEADGYAHLAKGTEFDVGHVPPGLKQTVPGTRTFDFTNDYWDLTLDNLNSTSKTIEQKFRAQDLVEGFWLDYKGRPAPGPCELGN